MACYNADSKAVIITVNRVQDFIKNPFDGNSVTDPAALARMYNEENIRLDIGKISAINNNEIYVGLEYFILTNGCSQFHFFSVLICSITAEPSCPYYKQHNIKICF